MRTRLSSLGLSLALLCACGSKPTGNSTRPGASTNTGGSMGGTATSESRTAPRAIEHVCEQCVLEDARQAAHQEQVVVNARYLGLKEAWLDGERTKQACTRSGEVMGVVRFALTGPNPWLQPSATLVREQIVEADLPCPELSRPEYAKLYRYDPDDTLRDGLGHAPVLRRGREYRLTFVKEARITMRAPSHPTGDKLVLTLVAVNQL